MKFTNMLNKERDLDIIVQLLRDEKRSYEEVGRMYGVTGVGIKKFLKRSGVELERRRTINPREHFNRLSDDEKYGICPVCGERFFISWKGKTTCSAKCTQELKRQEFIERWKNGEDINGGVPHLLSKIIKNYLLERSGHKCERCGWSETNEYHEEPPLQIHHIDGDSTNHSEENLIVLCPNCHALTENFGAKNRNGTPGRSDYFGKGKDGWRKKKAKMIANFMDRKRRKELEEAKHLESEKIELNNQVITQTTETESKQDNKK